MISLHIIGIVRQTDSLWLICNAENVLFESNKMTVKYYHDVLTAGPIGFLKLLIRWKGSILKLIYSDFLLFAVFYVTISVVYRFVLLEENKRQFETVINYVSKSQALIPVAFIVGFYVNLIFNRFWQHFNTIPWISKTALLISTFFQDPEFSSEMSEEDIRKEKEKTRLQKRTIIRYLVASLMITLSRVSIPVKRRFKTINELSIKGILLEHESDLINKSEPYIMQPFLPVMWATSIIIKANDKKRIPNESLLIGMIEEINKFRQQLQELFLLDQICIPLVYTQVVTLAIYSYFLSCLVGRQFVIDSDYMKSKNDFIIPIFTILQFIVYIGWIKLALSLVNPMGEDDEDFDLNTLIDYNFQTGMSSVERLKSSQPPFEKDFFFNSKIYKLPLNEKSRFNKARPFRGSFCEMRVDNENWIASIKSLIIDRETSDDGLLKSLSNLSKQPSPRVRRQTPIFSPISYVTNFTSPGKDDSQSEIANAEIVNERRKKSSEKPSLLAIVEEDSGSSHEIKINVTNH